MVLQCSMKMPASAFCSRIPRLSAIASAMRLALSEYSAHRQ